MNIFCLVIGSAENVVIKQEAKNYDEFVDDNYDEAGFDDDDSNWIDDELINDDSTNDVLPKVVPKKRKIARVKMEKFPDQTEVKPEAIKKPIMLSKTTYWY